MGGLQFRFSAALEELFSENYDRAAEQLEELLAELDIEGSLDDQRALRVAGPSFWHIPGWGGVRKRRTWRSGTSRHTSNFWDPRMWRPCEPRRILPSHTRASTAATTRWH